MPQSTCTYYCAAKRFNIEYHHFLADVKAIITEYMFSGIAANPSENIVFHFLHFCYNVIVARWTCKLRLILTHNKQGGLLCLEEKRKRQ